MDKVQKQDSSKCNTPSSEPYDFKFVYAALLTLLHWNNRLFIQSRPTTYMYLYTTQQNMFHLIKPYYNL
jgi:hypothetical protein